MSALLLTSVLGDSSNNSNISNPQLSPAFLLTDASFSLICKLVSDISWTVRCKAFLWLGNLVSVSESILWRTFQKIELKIHGKNPGESVPDTDEQPSSSEYLTGEHDINFGSSTYNARTSIQSQSAASAGSTSSMILHDSVTGVFTLGFEDEYSEVRQATIESVFKLSQNSTLLFSTGIACLVEMFNDEIEEVRQCAIDHVSRFGKRFEVTEDLLTQSLLSGLKDQSLRIRHALHHLLSLVQLPNIQALKRVVLELLKNLGKHPVEDKLSIFECLHRLGNVHYLMAEYIFEQLLGLEPHLLLQQPMMDIQYEGKLIFVLNAAIYNLRILNLLPEYMIQSHMETLKLKYPQFFKQYLQDKKLAIILPKDDLLSYKKSDISKSWKIWLPLSNRDENIIDNDINNRGQQIMEVWKNLYGKLIEFQVDSSGSNFNSAKIMMDQLIDEVGRSFKDEYDSSNSHFLLLDYLLILKDFVLLKLLWLQKQKNGKIHDLSKKENASDPLMTSFIMNFVDFQVKYCSNYDESDRGNNNLEILDDVNEELLIHLSYMKLAYLMMDLQLLSLEGNFLENDYEKRKHQVLTLLQITSKEIMYHESSSNWEYSSLLSVGGIDPLSLKELLSKCQSSINFFQDFSVGEQSKSNSNSMLTLLLKEFLVAYFPPFLKKLFSGNLPYRRPIKAELTLPRAHGRVIQMKSFMPLVLQVDGNLILTPNLMNPQIESVTTSHHDHVYARKPQLKRHRIFAQVSFPDLSHCNFECKVEEPFIKNSTTSLRFTSRIDISLEPWNAPGNIEISIVQLVDRNNIIGLLEASPFVQLTREPLRLTIHPLSS